MLHVVSIRCHMWLVYVRVCGVCTMVSGTATAAGSGGSFSLSASLRFSPPLLSYLGWRRTRGLCHVGQDDQNVLRERTNAVGTFERIHEIAQGGGESPPLGEETGGLCLDRADPEVQLLLFGTGGGRAAFEEGRGEGGVDGVPLLRRGREQGGEGGSGEAHAAKRRPQSMDF